LARQLFAPIAWRRRRDFAALRAYTPATLQGYGKRVILARKAVSGAIPSLPIRRY
jgi:hypothetical protein